MPVNKESLNNHPPYTVYDTYTHIQITRTSIILRTMDNMCRPDQKKITSAKNIKKGLSDNLLIRFYPVFY